MYVDADAVCVEAHEVIAAAAEVEQAPSDVGQHGLHTLLGQCPAKCIVHDET